MSKITLKIDELEKILEFAKNVNPYRESDKLSSGLVEVEFENGSGIGYLIKVSVPVIIDKYDGIFCHYINSVKDW